MKKIYLISPREPSGATWLINCFLELGIKTFRYSTEGMWHKQGNEYVLNQHETILKKWLPCLWLKENFKFRSDTEIQWTHEWPTKDHDSHKVIFFTRDPKDSLYSRYRRERPQQSFIEFMNFPDTDSLLNKIDHWNLFTLAWLEHSNHKVFRFEDYKTDARNVLKTAVSFIGVKFSSAEIERAVRRSSFEKAVEAESRYREINPNDPELINRGGIVGEWKGDDTHQDIFQRIDFECGYLLQRLGYIRNSEGRGINDYPSNYSGLIASLSFLKQVKLPTAILAGQDGRDILVEVLVFMQSLNRTSLSQACLKSHEVECLLNGLDELANVRGEPVDWSSTALRKEYASDRSLLVRSINSELSRTLLERIGLYHVAKNIYKEVKSWRKNV